MCSKRVVGFVGGAALLIGAAIGIWVTVLGFGCAFLLSVA